MFTLQKWAQGKPPLLTIFAQQTAITAHVLSDYLSEIKTGDALPTDFHLPSLQNWLPLYRQHRKVTGFLREMFTNFTVFENSDGEFLEDFLSGLQILCKSDKEEFVQEFNSLPEQEKLALIREAHLQIDALYSHHQAELSMEVEGKVDPDDQERFLELFSDSPSIGFYILVWVPCLILYRQTPPILYRKARLGNLDALKMLLRLDPSLIHDPAIGKKVHQLRCSGKRSAHYEVLSSLSRPPKGKTDRGKIKVSLAGCISLISSMFRSPLNEPDIRELFDAVTRDCGRGDIDTDLPESPEAFAKAIQRERKIWLKELSLDKT